MDNHGKKTVDIIKRGELYAVTDGKLILFESYDLDEATDFALSLREGWEEIINSSEEEDHC